MKIAKKQLIKLIKEQVGLSSDLKNAFEILQQNNGEKTLSDFFKPYLGFSAQISMSIKNDVYINVISKGFIDKLDKVSKLIFKDINLSFYGEYLKSQNKILFRPSVAYSHVAGGSNGIDIICDLLSYDCVTNKWKIEREF